MSINNKRNFAVIKNIFGMLPVLFIFVMFILHFALPDKTFSKEEQRYLTQLPVFRIEKVLNGSYQIQVEAYFSDQFPLRSVWVQVQDGIDYMLFIR